MATNAAVPEPKANMGAPAARIDARVKVTGQARYASDEPLANPAHGWLVTSPISKGHITRIDTTAARRVAGLLDILTYQNAGTIKGSNSLSKGGTASTSIVPLSSPRIWHDGQIVALVVSETLEGAQHAASLLQIDYAAEPPTAGFDSAGTTSTLAAAASPRHKDPKVGDAEAAFAAAPFKVDAHYATPTEHHNPIELFTTSCVWSGDELTIYEPSQFVYGLKNGVAEQLGIDPAKVRVVSRYIGGAFGSKGGTTPRTAIVAYAARRLDRPVKLVPMRQQGYTIVTYRAETRHHVRLGAARDGKLNAYLHEGREISSRPDDYFVGGNVDTSRMYAFGNVLTKATIVHADRNTPGFMRSPAETPYMFALETAMDEMAVALAMDPVEFRRINDTMTDPITGKPYSSRSLMKCYDEASRAFGWEKRNPVVGSMRDGDWLIGWGCATATYPTLSGPVTARVQLTSKGKATVQIAAHELGGGTYTIVAQRVADQLGLPLENVSVQMGDSRLPAAPVSGGSNSTASTASVLGKACEAIRGRLAGVAAKDSAFAGQSPDSLSMKDGLLKAPNGASMKLEDAFKTLSVGVVEEFAEWYPKGTSAEDLQKLYAGSPILTGGSKGDKMMFAFGAEFVEVRVHARTREIRVPRIVGAFAAGHIMNPRTARSQLMGGMIWGIGAALLEKTEVDQKRARYVNNDIAEYLVAVNADIPQLEVIMVPEVDHDVNPAGVKGLGELGNVSTPAAISAAIYHATGTRLRELPMRLEGLL